MSSLLFNRHHLEGQKLLAPHGKSRGRSMELLVEGPMKTPRELKQDEFRKEVERREGMALKAGECSTKFATMGYELIQQVRRLSDLEMIFKDNVLDRVRDIIVNGTKASADINRLVGRMDMPGSSHSAVP
ncbi:MAG: hypothetical protein V1909_03745 [Candidatus Micrarchaeota archaeon]